MGSSAVKATGYWCERVLVGDVHNICSSHSLVHPAIQQPSLRSTVIWLIYNYGVKMMDGISIIRYVNQHNINSVSSVIFYAEQISISI